MKTILLCIFLQVVAFHSGKGQATLTNGDSAVIGVWKGTSLCQVKNSPCHDEIVVYYISDGDGLDLFDIKANKVVNGVEEGMGTIPCKLDRKSSRLISTAGKGTWKFDVKGKAMNGTLTVNGALYRIVKLSKQE